MLRAASVLIVIQRVFTWLAAAALGIMPVIIFYDVAMRYLFRAPTIWVTEVSVYLLQFLVFTTLGMLVVTGDHLRVTFWIERLQGAGRRAAEIVTALLVLPYAFALIWYGWIYTDRALQRGMLSPTLLQIPLWTVYILIPAGGVLLVLAIVARCLDLAGRPYSPEVGA
jgi:C4-dicarboxylate transporter DctQ subunit